MSYNFESDMRTIAQFFPLYNINPQKQIAKVFHRRRLVDFWSIEKGSTVLEIGCGQGDTTAVIASIVGEHGNVVAVDSADPKYGYPVNCEDSSAQLLKSPIGRRIQFLYNFDILKNFSELPLKHFNYIVFSYSSWYFENELYFSNTLKKLRCLGGKLAFAEWCIIPDRVEQFSHLLSVLIQNQIKLYNNRYETNICNILFPDTLRQTAKNSGWLISNEAFIDSKGLNDGVSEVEKVFNEGLSEIIESNAPEWFRRLLQVEISLFETIKNNFEILPLSTYAFVAEGHHKNCF